MGTQKEVIDKIIDNGPQLAGAFLYDDLAGSFEFCFSFHLRLDDLLSCTRYFAIFSVLFKRELIYFDVPVEDDDILVGTFFINVLNIIQIKIYSFLF